MIEFLTDIRTITPIFSMLLLLSSSIFLLALIKPPNKIAYLLALFLLSFSQIVFSELVANSFNLLNQVIYVLLIQTIIFILVVLLWLFLKRPPLFLPFRDIRAYLSPNKIANYLHNSPEILHLLMAVGLAYGLSFIIGVVVPTNTYDAITTHASRIGYWLQHGNFFPWDTSRVLQLSYPVNAQLIMLWTAQVRGTDKFYFLVQWSAAIATFLSVIGFARLLNYSRSKSLFAGLLYLCFPLIIMQSNTAQNDLIAAALFVPTVYFFILAFQSKQKNLFWLSALSLGLSLGTKQTIYFYLPGLAFMVIVPLLQYKKKAIKQLLHWALACITMFIVFAAYMNISNMVNFGNPFGTPEMVEYSVGGKDASSAVNNILYNTPRFLYQFIDSSGLPDPLDKLFAKARYKFIGIPMSKLPIELESELFCAPSHDFSFEGKAYVSEDSSWFGPVAAILLIPLTLYQLFYGIKNREYWRIALILISFSYLIIDAWLRPGWDPFQGRYFIPAIVFIAPFTAEILRPGWGWRTVSMLATFASILVLITSLVNNPSKPVFRQIKPEQTIWQAERLTLISIQNQSMVEYSEMVDDYIPKDAVLGWYGHQIVEYPLFGRKFERTIIPIYPLERIYDADWMMNNNIEYVLIEMSMLPDGFPEGYDVLVTSENPDQWAILIRSE